MATTSSEADLSIRIAEKMKQFMKEHKIRYALLGEATGLSEQAISNQLNLHRRFSAKTAEKWATGLELLGFPINFDYLLTGKGPITFKSELDPDANPHYSPSCFSQEENECLSDGVPRKPTFEDAIVKIIRLRRERNYLHEFCQSLIEENHALRLKLAAIRDILDKKG